MNHVVEFLLQLTIILIATKLAGDLAARLGQPSVLGELLAGVLIGTAVASWVEPSVILEVFAQIGVLLLMFLAGLETDLRALNENRNTSIAVAVGGMLFPLAGGIYRRVMARDGTGTCAVSRIAAFGNVREHFSANVPGTGEIEQPGKHDRIGGGDC
jgi:Kef-type K+ transport system membrane component KefB